MKKIIICLSCFIALVFANEQALYIVNEGTNLPKIILKDNSSLDDAKLKKNFYNIILNDLKVSSNFEVLEKGDEKGNYVFEYNLSKSTNNALNLQVIVRANEVEKLNQNYGISSLEQYPFLAHTGVKNSVKALGLSPVEWMDHKILISRANGSKQSQIILADYTLTYQKVIINKGLNLFPKWANKNQDSFYYTAADHQKPTLFLYDLKTNKSTRILSSSGMIVASDVSADANSLLVTMAPSDQPDVYLYKLKQKSLQKLTNYSGIDVNGNFIDNDSKFVFVSDRLGYPNIFMQDLKSSNTEQVIFHGRNNSAVSTYKNYIVYSSREAEQRGVFNIYLMSIDSDYIRQLTANGKNLFPRFSSDGGSIVFIKYLGNETALGIIRVNANKTFHFPLKIGKIQSIDW